MSSLIHTVWQRRELVGILIARNLKIRYKGSVLGFLWSLLTPGLFILMYAIFARIMRFGASRPDYLPFLVTGIIVWQFVSMALNDSLYAISGNANLVKKTAFPRIILPLSMTLANAINFLLTLAVLGLYLLFAGQGLGPVFWLVPALMVQLILCLGLALTISCANVFFRDTEQIIGVGTLAWFFMTPIFYPLEMQLDMLPDHLHALAFLNPMTGVVSVYRTAFLGDALPAASGLGLSLLVSVVVLAIGLFTFQRAQARFGDEL